jgi:cell wall-associated NlpC family hydrolase
LEKETRVLPKRRFLRASGRFAAILVTLAATISAVALPAGTAHAEPSLAQIQRRIEAESHRLEKVVERYNAIKESIKENTAEAGRVRAAIAPLAAELATETDRLGELAALAYKGGALAEVSAMLSAESPSAVVDRLLTLDQITKFETAQLASVRDAKARHDSQAGRLAQLIADEKAKQRTLADERRTINKDLAKLYEMRRLAYGRSHTPSSSGGGSVKAPKVSGRAGAAVRYAYAQLGKPYVWGGAGPGGFDCSGLTMAAWRKAGVSLPHNAAMQYRRLPKISRSALRPGDLVFYSGLGHVGIYVGNGKIIHSPTFGQRVKLVSINIMRPYGYARPG